LSSTTTTCIPSEKITDMPIVKASLQDVAAIREVAYATWPHTFKEILEPEQISYMLEWMYSESAIITSINDPKQSFWLFMHEGKAAGFAAIEHAYNGEKATKLHKIYVLPEAQGLQIGKQLLELVINEARLQESERLILNVNRFNKAIAFYEHLGFHTVREETINIGEGYLMDDFVMEKAL